MIEHEGLKLEWLGYATVRLAAAGTVVYLDPGRYGVLDGYEPGDGDVICVSHDHHYDSEAVRSVAGEDATLVAFEGLNTHRIDRDVERPVDLPCEVRRVDDEADVLVDDAIVRTTAAYNDPDGPHVGPGGKPYHPEGFGCGFHVTLDGTSVCWPGDTDVLAGQERLAVDVFCPPIGGTYTMDRHAAAELAEAMAPSVVVPVHYDTFEAIEADAEAFVEDCRSRGVSAVLDE
ncbi:MBL fold metallo-hydrolase [Natronomonas marina]|jgi:L-ascorbate metabolism protein UlaG (beta-lactamase superfamily)|uniref:MBL fold metallo-hydrolase n=1 Tax=Natronomonas marina TaxID=2961939 RepID=UPI0020C99520|nr:MBL fold metallo-hydrolase [Natronomonas marina]